MTIQRLSVLDLLPVRAGQTTGQALAAAIDLAVSADRAGIHRYWVAEHHNMPAVAATNPPVLIAMLAGATERMRVGSGGVMLPNHAPLVVAEQFALLEAAHPGRIDLGIGRAPGSDPVTNWALRHGGPETADARVFDQHVANLLTMMAPGGASLQLDGGVHPLLATPHAVSVPRPWLLGSSDYSARLAATMGLPYVFAHHFSGSGTAEALELYRSQFQPSEYGSVPETFLTVNVVVADTAAQAEALARPQLLGMIALRTGGALQPQRSVEEAAATPIPPQHRQLADGMRNRWVIGTPSDVAHQLDALAAEFEVDEVMINLVAGAFDADPADRWPARVAGLTALAAELLGTDTRRPVGSVTVDA